MSKTKNFQLCSQNLNNFDSQAPKIGKKILSVDLWMPFPTGAQLGRCLSIWTSATSWILQTKYPQSQHHTNFVATHLARWIPTLSLASHLAQIWSGLNIFTNVTNSCKKVLGVIDRNFRSCSCDIKSKLYLSLVQPKLEYVSAAWHPITKQDTHTSWIWSKDPLHDYAWMTTQGNLVSPVCWKIWNGKVLIPDVL